MLGRTIGALTLWSLGYADQAWQWMDAARALAHQVSHATSLAHVAVWAAILAQCCRDVPAVQGHADALLALGAEYGLTHRLEQIRLLRGWVLAMQGEAALGVAYLRQGLAATQGGGLKLCRPYFLALLAEAYGLPGRIGEIFGASLPCGPAAGAGVTPDACVPHPD